MMPRLHRPPRAVAPALAAVALLFGCRDAFNVVEDPGPATPDPNAATPTPTPWLDGHLTYTPEALDFGPVPIGCRGVVPLVIRNDGQQPVQIFGMAPSLSTSTEFIVDQQLGTLAPFDSTTLSVGYVPINAGADVGSLLIQSDVVDDEIHGIPLSGQDSGSGERVDRFTQPPGTPADFIWLLDTSGSMDDDIDKVISNFDVFMQQLYLLDIDYQMALLTTSLDDEGYFQGSYGEEGAQLPWITRDMGEPAIEQFTTVMYNKSRELRQTGERGLDQLTAALTDDMLEGPHNGFLREGSRLVITVFSDEDDHSAATPGTVAARLQTVKPEAQGQTTFSSIVGLGAPTNGCPVEDGFLFMELSYQFDGYIDDVCRASYTSMMATLGEQGASAQSVFPLSGWPELSYPIEVTVDSEPVAPSPTSGPEPKVGWVYDEIENLIVFGSEAVPRPGAEVAISYLQKSRCD